MENLVDNHIFEEAGVHYSHTPLEGYTEIKYKLQRLENKQIFDRVIYVLEFKKINDLFQHWNRSEHWKVFT